MRTTEQVEKELNSALAEYERTGSQEALERANALRREFVRLDTGGDK